MTWRNLFNNDTTLCLNFLCLSPYHAELRIDSVPFFSPILSLQLHFHFLNLFPFLAFILFLSNLFFPNFHFLQPLICLPYFILLFYSLSLSDIFFTYNFFSQYLCSPSLFFHFLSTPFQHPFRPSFLLAIFLSPSISLILESISVLFSIFFPEIPSFNRPFLIPYLFLVQLVFLPCFLALFFFLFFFFCSF